MRQSVNDYQDFVERTHGYDEPGPSLGVPRGQGYNPWSLADDLSVYEDDRGPYLTRRQAARAAQMQRKLKGQRFNPYYQVFKDGKPISAIRHSRKDLERFVDMATHTFPEMRSRYDIRETTLAGRWKGKRSKNPRRRRWIGRAIKRPGALRNKFARWYGLKKGQKISPSMYSRGYARAKKRGDTRTMRQINLARSLSRLRRRKKSRRRGRVIRGVSFRPAARRRVANPRRRRSKNGRFVKARKRRRARRRNCRR